MITLVVRTLMHLVVSVLLSTCTGPDEQPNYERILKSYTVPSAKELYPEALQLAQVWNSTAYLDQIMLNVKSTSVQDRLFSSFGFRSHEYFEKYLNIYFYIWNTYTEIRKSPGEFETEREIGPSVIPTELALDSNDILAIALRNGGGEFIQNRRYESLDMFLLLEHQQNDGQYQLVWRGSFLDLTTLESIDITIDPNTGEVLKIRKIPDD